VRSATNKFIRNGFAFKDPGFFGETASEYVDVRQGRVEYETGFYVASGTNPGDQLLRASHSALSRCKRAPAIPKKPAGLADVATDALRVLQRAQLGLDLRCLDLLISWILHPELPAMG
jgi:hypothetical protein